MSTTSIPTPDSFFLSSSVCEGGRGHAGGGGVASGGGEGHPRSACSPPASPCLTGSAYGTMGVWGGSSSGGGEGHHRPACSPPASLCPTGSAWGRAWGGHRVGGARGIPGNMMTDDPSGPGTTSRLTLAPPRLTLLSRLIQHDSPWHAKQPPRLAR